MCNMTKATAIHWPISPLVDRSDLPATLNSTCAATKKRRSLSMLEQSSTPATNSLMSLLQVSEPKPANKRRRKSAPAFDVSSLFSSLLSNHNDFPSLEWDFEMESTKAVPQSIPEESASTSRRGLVRSKKFQATSLR